MVNDFTDQDNSSRQDASQANSFVMKTNSKSIKKKKSRDKLQMMDW